MSFLKWFHRNYGESTFMMPPDEEGEYYASKRAAEKAWRHKQKDVARKNNEIRFLEQQNAEYRRLIKEICGIVKNVGGDVNGYAPMVSSEMITKVDAILGEKEVEK